MSSQLLEPMRKWLGGLPGVRAASARLRRLLGETQPATSQEAPIPELSLAELVRELEAAYASGAALQVARRASPYQWANACHDLFEAGRIDIVEYAARNLHMAYPEVPYLATMVAWFDAIPRDLPEPLAFSDDPAAEIQIVKRPGCDVVLLCFCATNGTLGLPINLVHQWLGRLPASLVYIKDLRNLGGARGFPTLGPDPEASAAALRRITDEIGAKEVYSLGVSIGGYTALYYGLKVEAVAILSLAGAVDYSPEFIAGAGPSAQYRNLSQQAPDFARNLRLDFEFASHKPHFLMVYSSRQARDRRQAERMMGLSNVELVAIDYDRHNVVDPLIREGAFLPLLLRFISQYSDKNAAG